MAVIESMVKQGLGGAQLPVSYYDWYTTKRSWGGVVMCSAGIEISLIPSTFSVNEERLQQKATCLSIPDFV